MLLEKIQHEKFMKAAINQAQLAADIGEVPTGCVIVQFADSADANGGKIIGKAHNQVEMLRDPTAHAEMIAITQAASAIGDWRLLNTILYVTKEPCAMCAGAIVLARIPIVVFGARDTLRGGAVSAFNILNNKNLNHRCEIIENVLETQCAGLLKDFFKKRRISHDSSDGRQQNTI